MSVNGITRIAFTPDGQRVVTAHPNGTLHLWKVTDGKLLATLSGHTAEVSAIAVSPRDGIIASGGMDRSIRLWDGQTGQFIKALDQGSVVTALSFSPDGRYLVSGVDIWSVGGRSRRTRDMAKTKAGGLLDRTSPTPRKNARAARVKAFQRMYQICLRANDEPGV